MSSKENHFQGSDYPVYLKIDQFHKDETDII